MSTPHNTAAQGDFAKTVLMPGDPLRAKFIAETFLKDARLVNNVRGIQGYTGTYQDTPVSVMASGMGMPSMGIYSYELFKFFDVDNIIRIGSAGAMSKELKLRDVVAAQIAVAIARRMGVRMPVGNVLSSDVFYDASGASMDWAKMGVLCAEMESAALYCNAAYTGKRALSLLTISDSIVTGEELPAEDRQTTFTQMMEIALNVAVEMAGKG